MTAEFGKLFIVPTPIGNLHDITERAITTLQSVDIIAAEDTRHSSKLLQHFGIKTKTIALHDHNEKKRAQHLINIMKGGESVALISDAGTPLISDPGYSLVSACRASDIVVSALPGPCAAITALSASGMPTDRFMFYGFPPVKRTAKQRLFSELVQNNATAVFYESPRRILDSIETLTEVVGGQREVVLGRELTKTFEQYYCGCLDDAINWLNEDLNHQRGEFVFIVSGSGVNKEDIPDEAIQLLKSLVEHLPLKKAAAIVAEHYDLKKNALYQLGLSWNNE